jgi:hypothetical protein
LQASIEVSDELTASFFRVKVRRGISFVRPSYCASLTLTCIGHHLTYFNSEGKTACSSGLTYKFIRHHNPEDHSLNITLEQRKTGDGANKKQN